ncbi:MAG: hypothetical protein JNL01_13025 [Bdellovibrionales bacterium]|nr:hypothetical protein [Bdellovibrionales bacterium]
MKRIAGILLFASLIVPSLVSAQELRLADKKEAAGVASVAVVRDSKTPDKVKLTLTMPFQYNTCVRHETRMVYGQDSSCGYDTRYESRTSCSNRQVCTVYKDGVCKSSKTERSCHTTSVPVTVTRSCYHPETYCAEYGTVTYNEQHTVKLKFGKLDSLKAGEEERYLIEGRQRSYGSSNADFKATVIDSLEPTSTKSKAFLGSDTIVFERAK